MLNAAANCRRFVAAISDFGLSRIAGSGGRHTQTVGTVRAMEPAGWRRDGSCCLGLVLLWESGRQGSR